MKFLDRWLRPKVDPKKNILLTGVPRSGTTLSCHLLNGLSDCVALHEPMEVRDLMAESNPQKQLQQIHTFLHQNRRSIQKSGRAISIHKDGKVPDNPVAQASPETGKRELDITRGEIKIDGSFDENSFLVIKHPAVFTGLLPILVQEFQVFAVVRNPISVLGSWMTMPFGVKDGHSPAAEGVDEELRTRLAAIGDVCERQLQLLSWYFEQYQEHLPADSVIRYEDVVATNGQALSAIVPSASKLSTPLKSRNKSKEYDASAMSKMGEALLASDGAYWQVYSEDDVKSILQNLPGRE